jgi:hypothetical protein
MVRIQFLWLLDTVVLGGEMLNHQSDIELLRGADRYQVPAGFGGETIPGSMASDG